MIHVLLTRFNLPSVGEESLIRAEEGWLLKRWELFTRFCLPSVKNQTVSSFSWLIYLDPESPGWLLAEMDSLADQKIATPILRISVCTSELLADIGQVTGRSTERLVTSNLDNDDAIAPDFLERVQGVEHALPCAVYLTNGLIRTQSGVYQHNDPVNAFCSVIDEGENPNTCWIDWHNLLPKHLPSVELGGQPGWLQVVHGSNVSNRLRGHLIDAGSILDQFPGMLDEIAPPRTFQLAFDRFFLAPTRVSRDFVRRKIKEAVMNMVGKSGLERIRLAKAKLKAIFQTR